LSSWYPLYTEYAIASLPEPCLVHIPSLYQQFLLQKLQQASFPFEGRPLHVPIYIEKSKKELKELAELGIEVQIEKGLIVLKSIPKLLPHLHITTFLEAYNAKEAYQREALFHLLVAHTPFIPGEEEALLLFLQAHKELCQKTQAVALLTEKHCRELLYA
jgi:hypothetical protein